MEVREDSEKEKVDDYITGILEIIVGLFIAFFGGPFITLVFPLIMFIGFTILLYSLLLMTNLVDGLRQEKVKPVLLSIAACGIVSSGIAYALHSLIKRENVLKFITAFAVGGLVSIVVAPVNWPLWAQLLTIFAGAAIGYFGPRG